MTNKLMNEFLIEESERREMEVEFMRKKKAERLCDEFAMAALTGLLANTTNEYMNNADYKFLIRESYAIGKDAIKYREDFIK